MRKSIVTLLFILSGFLSVQASGVAIVDVSNGIYLKLLATDVQVTVENQVAVVVARQTFQNDFSMDKDVKYGFPMPEDASATQLRFQVNGQWYKAKFSPTPQDTTLPGTGDEIDANLKMHLGETPLYYNIDHTVEAGSILIVELTYVQLLPYSFGKVDFFFPNDYRYIQTYPIASQTFHFTLTSERTIRLIELKDMTPDSLFNDGSVATVSFTTLEDIPKYNYSVQYELSLDQLGLFSMSTFLADSSIPDGGGRGFFTFIAEPDPSENTEVIKKVFTLIVDRSGSMSGDKIVQARNAAKFIVENLNEGDRFNIVDFSTNVSNYQAEHVEYSPQTEQQALDYIDGFKANGWTNISGAFDVAIPQFANSGDSTANIIIFFTDGQPTVGVTETNALLSHIQQTIISNEVQVAIFAFGIGTDANEQFLTLLAKQNDGMAEFLGNDELEERITQFYLTIRNPVLLNTELSFSPQDVVSETYPQNLPSLYKGQQLIVSGRYNEAMPLTVTLSGTAFGKEVEYEYTMSLSDSTIEKNQFLSKIWAKQKIEHLLVEYYSLDESDPTREAVKEDIIAVSVNFGVLSPFTSFSGDEYTAIEEGRLVDGEGQNPRQFQLLGNYPNPFNPSTTIQFRINIALHKVIFVKIYNALGELVRVLTIRVDSAGIYELVWDGLLMNGLAAPSGNYFYVLDFGTGVLAGKMTLMK